MVIFFMRYFISLGSNLGRDRMNNLLTAIILLNDPGRIIKMSSVYETEPVNVLMDTNKFLNMVIEYECNLNPSLLLKKLKEIEQKMGRDLNNSHNKPRIIDLDILFAENQVVNSNGLIIPHTDIENRAYVLLPLKEIAPDFIHPVLKIPVYDLVKEISNTAKLLKYYDKIILK